jgi:hypothetical protein
MMNSPTDRFALALDLVANPAPGWYQGDFHCHTYHSDGVLSAPDLLALARQEGLDFFVITDHNTLDAYPHFGLPDGICVLPGLEVTFDRGHYNLFGLAPDRVQDASWLEPVTKGPSQLNQAKSGLKPNDLLAAGAAQGLLNSINHPLLAPWAWLFDQTELAHLHCLEIWNDPSWPDNRQANPLALAMWTRWLNAGYRITAIGGSDFHRPVNKPGMSKPPDRLGLPRTFVYAERLSGAAILDGLRRRQVYVSMGARVSFQAYAGDQVYPIGADLGEQAGQVKLTGEIAPCGRSGVARILQDGAIVAEALLTGESLILHHTATLDAGAPTWFRLDVLDGHGLLLAVTNPIFAGPVHSPTLRHYGDFVDVARLALR